MRQFRFGQLAAVVTLGVLLAGCAPTVVDTVVAAGGGGLPATLAAPPPPTDPAPASRAPGGRTRSPSRTTGTTSDTPAPESTDTAAPAAPGPLRTVVGRGRSVVLSFDDGPDPRWTPQVLDLLAAADVHAVFCVVGQQAKAYPKLVARIVAQGHQLCNHTLSHDEQLSKRPVEEVRRQILTTNDLIRTAAPDAAVRWFRAPGGRFTPQLDAMVASLGLTSLGWSVDPTDWRKPGTAAIVSRVTTHVRPGAIVLLHDGGGDRSGTVAALRVLLPALKANGYGFVLP